MKFKPGDRVKYYKKYQDYDHNSTPLWEGRYGKIAGTILKNNDEEFVRLYGDPGYDRICVKWDNGLLNGYNPKRWENSFQIIHEERQLKLFGGEI